MDDALGFLPDDAPLVVTIDTDVDGKQIKAARDAVDRLPFGDRIEDEVEDQLDDGDVSFQDDVKPLLGNEFVVGVTDVRSLANSAGSGSSQSNDFGDDDSDQDQSFVGAIRVKDNEKLEKLIKKEADEDGEVDGAKIYEENGGNDVMAIKDDALVVASSRSELEDALEQRGQDDRLTEKKFEKTVDGLPEEALVKVGGDLRALLEADPDSSEAREIKWVDALRTFGATISMDGDRADLDFKLGTAAGDLTDEDLPFATGDDSPPALDVPGEIGIGIRDPRQVARFIESAIDETNPGQLQTAKRALESRLKIDVDDDLIGQLEDEVALSVSPRGEVSARVELEDESAFRSTLAKIERTIPKAATIASPRTRCRRVRIPGTSRTRFTCAPRIRCRRVRVPGSTRTRISCTPSYTSPSTSSLTYPRRTEFGDTTVIRTSLSDSVSYKIDDGALLISSQSYRLPVLERETPESVPGAKGSVSVKADAGPLLQAVLRRSGLYYRLGLGSSGSGLGSSTLGSSLLSGSLDDLTGSMRTSKNGLVGNVRIELD